MSDTTPAEVWGGCLGCAFIGLVSAVILGTGIGLFVMFVKFFWNLV